MSKDSERFQVWLDGGMVAPEDAKVSVLTATAMRGANVYEGLRAYWDEVRDNLFVWKLDQHLERLLVNMKIMRMTSPTVSTSTGRRSPGWPDCRRRDS